MAFWKSNKEQERGFLHLKEDSEESEQRAVLNKLIEICQTRAEQIVKAAKSEYALSGRAFALNGEDIFFADVYLIVLNFARANGRFSEKLGRILLTVGSATMHPEWPEILRSPINQAMSGLRSELKGNGGFTFWLDYSNEHSDLLQQESEITVPVSVKNLAKFDQQNSATYGKDAASAFLNLATLVYSYRDSQFVEANTYVMNAYAQLLSPFLSSSSANDPIVGEVGTESAEGANACAECAAAYQALGLERGASREDIQAAYRDFAKMYHPDRFPESDQRLRVRAEAEFNKLQQAHNHIIEHSHD
ncbi:MAG: J domain-containing protein [Terracidiphilus sp.]